MFTHPPPQTFVYTPPILKQSKDDKLYNNNNNKNNNNISLILKIDKRNNPTNMYTKQYRNMAAIYMRHRHAELNSQSSTQVCKTLRLTCAHIHRGSATFSCIQLKNESKDQRRNRRWPRVRAIQNAIV